MGAFEFLLAFTFLAAGILASVGYTVITVTPADFKLARALFLIAGALVFTDGIMWGVLTDSPLWTRILIGGLIGAVSAVATNEAIRWINNREKIAEPPPAQTKSHIEASVPKLFMECAPANLPTVWPSGPLYVLPLNPIPAPYGNGLVEYGVNSGSPMNFGFQWAVYRCQITNYSETPIFNSAISLHLTFREAIQKVSQYEGGPITIDREWLIQIGKIDSGKDSPYTFFVFNMSAQFVEITLPRTISIQRDTGMDIINLITGPNVTMHFGPRLGAPDSRNSPTVAPD
jgi:hypothetical protein